MGITNSHGGNLDGRTLASAAAGHKGRSRLLTGVIVAYVIIGSLILLVPLLFFLVFAGLSLFS